MRMTFNRSSQLGLVSVVSLLAAGLVSACGTLTVDFVFVTSAKAAGPNNYGEINVYEVNSESGKMRQIPTSPFPSGGRNPVAEATAPDNTNLYVVNEDDNSIVQFIIGNDGKLYPQNTLNTPGEYPNAVSTGGKFLFVTDLYQPLSNCSADKPCSGSVSVYPIGSNDALGTPSVNAAISASYWPLTLPSNPTHVLTPTAITAAASGAFVYVTAFDANVTTGGGYVFGFAVNSDGTLSPLNGGVPVPAGNHPSAIASGPGGSNIYVTDLGGNTIYAFTATNGILTAVSGSPFQTGNAPAAVVADSTGKFVYVANSLDSNLTAYSSTSGVLTPVMTTEGQPATYTVGTQPQAIGIDPSMNDYLYTANFLGNSVSGFQINASTGTLLNSQGTPYYSNANPTAVAAIPHGTAKK